MQFLRNLATVMIRPRATMRRILEAPRNRDVLVLFTLAVVSGIFGDFDAPTLQQVLGHSRGPAVALLVAGVILGVVVVTVALSWFYAWVPYLIGAFLGGTGNIRGVRAALAWGLAPAIWALLYRVPVAILLAPAAASTVRMRDGNVAFDPGRLADGCGVILILLLIETVVFVWCAVVMSNTVAEAHGFSAWHALGTLVLAAIAPLVVVLAAVLAMG
jgi:hypothetical protein